MNNFDYVLSEKSDEIKQVTQLTAIGIARSGELAIQYLFDRK